MHQVELNILNNCGGLLVSIAKYVEGHSAELADQARKRADWLFELGSSKHHDLSKPF
jgi:hypothetical protein